MQRLVSTTFLVCRKSSHIFIPTQYSIYQCITSRALIIPQKSQVWQKLNPATMLFGSNSSLLPAHWQPYFSGWRRLDGRIVCGDEFR